MPHDATHQQSQAHRTRRPGAVLRRSVFREAAFPTLYTLLGLTLLVLSRELLGYSDLIVNRGLGAALVARIAWFQVVPLLSAMLPFAVLVGALVGLGRLAASHEILALEACGVAAHRLSRPVLRYSALAAGLGLALSAGLAPKAQRGLSATLEQIALDHPGASIRAGKIHHFGDWRLAAREVSSGGDRLRGVSIDIPTLGDTVFARAGTLEPDSAGGTRIQLEAGTLFSTSARREWRMSFTAATVDLPETVHASGRHDHDRFSALALGDLAALALDSAPAEAKGSERVAARQELHRRFSRPAAILVFGYLAVPLFLARGAHSRSGGGLLGLATILAYYALVQLGDGLVQAGSLPLAIGAWLPNAVLAALGAALAAWTRRRPLQVRRGSGRSLPKTIAPDPAEAWGAGEPSRPDEISGSESPAPHAHRWALQRDVAAGFLKLLGISFAALLVGYLVVDILERLQWFARYQATASEAIRFYGLRIPLLVSRIVPMSLLVATAMMVSLMGASGELTGMRCSGIPAPRGMLPVLLLCAAVVPLSFVLNDSVVPRTNRLAEILKATEIKVEELWRVPSEAGQPRRKAVWLLQEGRLLEAEQLDPQLGTVRGLRVYEIGPDGLPIRRLEARSGRHIRGGTWRLVEPMETEFLGPGFQRRSGSEFAELWEVVPTETDTRTLSVNEIREEIARADANDYDSTALRVDLYAKLAAPIACLLLPALVFLYSLSGPPYPRTASALVVCVAVALGSILLAGLSTSLGYGGHLSPMLAGWAPTAFFGIAAMLLGIRLIRAR